MSDGSQVNDSDSDTVSIGSDSTEMDTNVLPRSNGSRSTSQSSESDYSNRRATQNRIELICTCKLCSKKLRKVYLDV